MRNPSETPAQTEARHSSEHAAEMRYARAEKDKEIKELQNKLQQLKDESPDPADWQLLDDYQYGPYLVLRLKYPKCKNHKGEKILVFQATLSQIVKQKVIDPHFGDENSTQIANQSDSMIYPIARFAPGNGGLNRAIFFAKMLEKECG